MSFTRKQALALIEWGKRDPRVVEAYSDPSHPGHEEAMRYAARLLEIAHAPGGPDDAGEPLFDAEDFMARFVAGDGGAHRRLEGIIAGDVAPPPLDKPLPDDDALGDLRSLTPEAAQERIAALTTNADFVALLTKEKDPVAVAAWDLLNNLAAGGGGAPGAGEAAAAVSTDAQRQLEEIYSAAGADKDHPYANPLHPQHQAMQEKVMRLTEASVSGAGGVPAPMPVAPAAASGATVQDGGQTP